jgi:hypothetical protein
VATQPTPAAERRALREQFESRLAKSLYERGWVTQQGLEEAIRQQVLLGGHLATNLWELGLVDGRALSKLSAELLGVTEAMPKMLAKIPSEVTTVLPHDVVERTRVMPIEVLRSVLKVATCEPWDHLALGEVARVAGHPLETYFVAEVPLVRLLRRHYRIPLLARFMVSRPVIKAAAWSKAKQREQEDDGWWEDLPELPDDIATIIESGTPGQSREPAVIPLKTLNVARLALAGAEDRDAIATVLLRFALSLGSRALLLTHRNSEWHGWLGAGVGIDNSRVRALSIPAASGTVFGLVSSTGAYYLGPLSAHPQHLEFLHFLGEIVPGSVAFLPVYFRGKLAFGLYLDGGERADVATDVAEVLTLAQAVPAALERLISVRIAASRTAGHRPTRS